MEAGDLRPRPAMFGGRAGLAVSFALGALAATGQAPLGWAWAALAAFMAVFALFAPVARWQAAALRGWVLGTGYFAAALFWLVEPFFVDAARYGWMAPFALVFMAGGLALFWALAFGLAAGFGHGPRQRAALLVVTLTAAEMLRSYVFTGFPWALIGHVWIGWPQMQAAAVVGAHGLTLLTLLAAAMPVFLGSARFLLGVIAGAALVSLPAGFVLRRLPDGPAAPVEPPVIVRLVQPNATQRLKWDPEMAAIYYQRQLDLTQEPPEKGSARPDMIVWPETAIPYLLEHAQPVFDQIAAAAAGAEVVLGVQRRDPGNRWFNSLVLLDPEGRVRSLYDKHHLVPFGEYIPFAEIFARWGFFGLAANDTGGYQAGAGPMLLDSETAGRFLPLICYEAIFPNDIARAPGRPQFLLQITNDAWFGELSGPYQHLAQARLRAVEQGLPLFRAANTGVSAAFDPYGREIARLPLGVAGFADARLPAPLPPTLYARLGDLPVALALLAAAGGLGVAILRRRPVDLGRKQP